MRRRTLRRGNPRFGAQLGRVHVEQVADVEHVEPDVVFVVPRAAMGGGRGGDGRDDGRGGDVGDDWRRARRGGVCVVPLGVVPIVSPSAMTATGVAALTATGEVGDGGGDGVGCGGSVEAERRRGEAM